MFVLLILHASAAFLPLTQWSCTQCVAIATWYSCLGSLKCGQAPPVPTNTSLHPRLQVVGRGSGQDVDALQYQHPAYVRVLALLATIVSGCGMAFVLDAGLGDATWGVSSGIASCLAAGVYEIGRPERLSVAKATKLEDQWHVFCAPRCRLSIQVLSQAPNTWMMIPLYESA